MPGAPLAAGLLDADGVSELLDARELSGLLSLVHPAAVVKAAASTAPMMAPPPRNGGGVEACAARPAPRLELTVVSDPRIHRVYVPQDLG